MTYTFQIVCEKCGKSLLVETVDCTSLPKRCFDCTDKLFNELKENE